MDNFIHGIYVLCNPEFSLFCNLCKTCRHVHFFGDFVDFVKLTFIAIWVIITLYFILTIFLFALYFMEVSMQDGVKLERKTKEELKEIAQGLEIGSV